MPCELETTCYDVDEDAGDGSKEKEYSQRVPEVEKQLTRPSDADIPDTISTDGSQRTPEREDSNDSYAFTEYVLEGNFGRT